MKRWVRLVCAVLVTSSAIILLYRFGVGVWTVLGTVLLLICPFLITVIALQQYRRAAREIEGAAAQLKRRTP